MLNQINLLRWEQLRREAEQERLANTVRRAALRVKRKKMRLHRRRRQ